jgi:S-DNA-T family DNA segregation ATPase FtsK/SpoIIIE
LRQVPRTGKRAPARRSTRGSTRRRRSPRARTRRRGPGQLLIGWTTRLRAAVASVLRSSLSPAGRDVLGLALVAAGVFLGFVLYGGWDGGRAGHGLSVALGWLLGGARVLAPLAIFIGGWMLLLGGVLPDLRPLRAGMACLFASITLALAAGTLGLSSGTTGGRSPWSADHLQHHGGVVGQALYEGLHRLVQDVGVGIVVAFLFIVGASLLTGTSLGGLLGALARALARIASAARARIAPPRETAAWGAAESAGPVVGASAPIACPDPPLEELFVRQAGAAAPDEDGQENAATPVDGERSPRTRTGAARGAPEGDEEEVPGVTYASGAALTPRGRLRDVVTDDPSFEWELPDAAKLLTRSSAAQSVPDTSSQAQVAAGVVEALGHFGVQAKVIGSVTGPHITRYELRLAPGTKVSKVAALKDDLAYALAATDIRILAPIPGKQAVGVEVPNAQRRIVRLGDVFQQPPPDSSPVTVWLGKDVAGKAIGADLAKMPHLLVAGTTGAGKSGAINAMLCSVLLRATPHEVRLVLVDPKQVELNHYESIPHLLTPVITSARMAANALQNLVREMEQRYGVMSLARTRSLVELNAHRQGRGETPLPYVLCVIDELADLMMVAPADVEDSIIRLAQKARAVGIHLVLATQSPRVDVITGMIKANVPSRIAFAVSSQTDSRVILDQNGAESLLGAGDMLFSPVGSSRLQRIQGAYIDERQIARLTEQWRRQGEPELREELLEKVEPDPAEGTGDELDPDEDPVLADAITLVAEMQTASTSMLQRRLRLGYTRAGRVIDMLERRGVISGYEGSKPRQVLITEADLPRVLASLGEPAATSSD